MLTKSIERLEETIDMETAALLNHDVHGQEEFARRKNQSLLELSRLARNLEGSPLDAEMVARIQRLREKLEANRSILEMNLRAVQEVSDIISGAIQNADSDGTYSVAMRIPG